MRNVVPVLCSKAFSGFPSQNKRQHPFSVAFSFSCCLRTLLSETFAAPGVVLLAPATLTTVVQRSTLPTQGFGACSFLFPECSSSDRLTWLISFSDSLKSHLPLQFRFNLYLRVSRFRK